MWYEMLMTSRNPDMFNKTAGESCERDDEQFGKVKRLFTVSANNPFATMKEVNDWLTRFVNGNGDPALQLHSWSHRKVSRANIKANGRVDVGYLETRRGLFIGFVIVEHKGKAPSKAQ